MIPLAWTYILRDYQKERLTSFLNPDPDIQGAGYQLYQAQIAVGSGGLARQGPDQRDARPRATSCPSRRPTSCSPMLAEELGFIGAMVAFVLFVPAAVADPRRAGGARGTRSARCSRRASRR